MYRITIFSGL